MRKWKEGGGAKLSGGDPGIVPRPRSSTPVELFWKLTLRWPLSSFGFQMRTSVRPAASCTLDSRAQGRQKTTQLETDALHFNQKSTVSLSYLALETGQSRAAVSCFSTLLTATALQISLSNCFFFSKLQRAGLPEKRRAPAGQDSRQEHRRGVKTSSA